MSSNDALAEQNSRSLNMLRDAIESLTEGFALYDHDHRLVMFNERYRQMNQLVSDILEPGLHYEIMLREMARRGGYTDAVGRENKWVSERLGNALDYAQNDEVSHTNGKCYLVSINPTKYGGFVVTRTDITERKQAETTEREGDLLMRRVMDTNPAAVIMAHLGSGGIIYQSPAAIALFGDVDSAREIYSNPTDRADYITDLLVDGQVDEYKISLINAMGDKFPALMYGRVAEYRGSEVVVTTTIDLTKQSEAEALIRQVLEACPVPIQMLKVDTGEVLFDSPQARSLFGKKDQAESYYVNSEDRELFHQELREKRTIVDRKEQYLDAKGSPFWGAVSSNLIRFNGEDVMVSNTRDLTEELALQEELTIQREMLFQNEKMSALGELLAGVAHELNNPLSIVVGHSLMLREETNDPETLLRIEKISDAAERCAKIVKTFLAMARQQPTKMEKVDIQSVIATAVDVAGYSQMKDSTKISARCQDDLPEINADADQITQVIINLLINAEHAIRNSGVGDRIEVSTTLAGGKQSLEIIVEDNGPGIPENIRARIFEPFFTTKNIGEGTGIGLAFCHRIIHSHGGQIRLEAGHPQGSKFRITLPVATETKKPVAESEIPSEAGNAKRALVVDDEKEVAELIAEILVKEGFHVDSAYSGAEALVCLTNNRYDMLLSDLNMPEMDGRTFYATLTSDYPDLAERTGFITGDTMGAGSQKFLRDTQRPYMEKPVSPNALRKLVYGMLDDTRDQN